MYGAREAYSLEHWTENMYGCRTELNSISCSILIAAEQVREKEATKYAAYVIGKNFKRRQN